MLHIINTSAACPPEGAAEITLISRGSINDDPKTSWIPFSIQSDPKSRAKHLHILCYIWSVWFSFVLHIHTGLHRLLFSLDGWSKTKQKAPENYCERRSWEREKEMNCSLCLLSVATLSSVSVWSFRLPPNIFFITWFVNAVMLGWLHECQHQ